ARLGGAPSGPTQAWRTLRAALLGLGALVVATAFALPSLAALPVPDADGFPWARGASVALLLLPVPLAAGAAFPALVRLAAVRSPSAAGRVYASETSGAVVGALLAGFLLVRFLGHLQSAVALGALALATGALVAVAFRREGRVAAAATVAPSELDSERLPASHLLAIALGGAAALALELLWTRVLLFFVPGLTGALAAV